MKYKVGDRCKVIKNLLAPNCIGEIVTVTELLSPESKILRCITEDGISCIVSENCLELVSSEQ